jgi:DNA helicase-2/ATP-dependent DNA helicase PcrA
MVITDFKTGSLEKSNKRFEFAHAYDPRKTDGGNYWRQAVFYKILSDNQKGKTKNLLNIEFHFIEPNDKGVFDKKAMPVDSNQESIVIEQIQNAWVKIQAHAFYKGCGKEDCDWCNFIKDHKLYTSLHEVEEEIVFSYSEVVEI